MFKEREQIIGENNYNKTLLCYNRRKRGDNRKSKERKGIMSKIGIFMADGCEEIEGLTVVDLVRRAGCEIEMISITGQSMVTGSHGITFVTDLKKEDADFSEYDGIVLPGGMPGTLRLTEDETVRQVIKEYAKEGKLVAAICAAPSVLGPAGILEGKKATCYPGWEDKLTGAEYVKKAVVKDGNMITSRGLGTAIEFASEIVAYLLDENAAKKLKESIIYEK